MSRNLLQSRGARTPAEPSHEPDGRASLSPASRVGRGRGTSSGSPGRTRPTGFKGRVHGYAFHRVF
ncbi:MAG: hypothetical protein FJ398_15670 [Verrucomicrobia bacterium]|nr:hypothetical protein [Verrucomicrobiota bacterium]